MRVRLARRGEGHEVARLAELALHGRTQGSTAGDLAEAIDRSGGSLLVPFGRSYAFVAEVEEAVAGLLYVTPPVRLAESYAERGETWQERLVWKVAEVQLLAVDEDKQGQGVASQLLAVAEESLRRRGCGAVLVKVLREQPSVVVWYRRRGYTMLGGQDYAMLHVGGREVPIASGTDGYLAGVKRLA